MSARKYWPITENDVYVRVFREILDELDLSFFPKDVIQSYQGLSLESQYVVTRLFLRTVKWLRQSELEKYLPPDKLEQVLEQLVETKWLLSDPTLGDYLETATIKELQQVATDFNIKKATTRPQLVAAVEELCRRKTFFGPPLTPKVTTKLKTAVTPLYLLNDALASTLSLLAFMFLAPARIGLDTMVRTNMKLVNFLDYDYVPQKDSPIFASKQDFVDYTEAKTLCDPLEESSATMTDELILTIKAATTHSADQRGPFSAAYVYGRGLALIAGYLGKQGRFQEEYGIIEHYLDQNAHKSRRSALAIRKLSLELKFHKELSEVSWLHRALNTYLDAQGIVNQIDQFDLSRKATRLVRDCEKAGLSLPVLELSKHSELPTNAFEAVQLEMQPGVGGRTRWGDEGSSSTVEETALIHYAEFGWAGGHYENGMISTIFWLVFYDIIFNAKSGLICRYQSRPMALQKVLDDNRSLIEVRANSEDLQGLAMAAFDKLSPSEPNIGSINWKIPPEGIKAVMSGLGSSLKSILLRLASSYHTFHSGFPDLTLWPLDPADSKKRCKFVEVKSTNDTISDNQYVWIQFLAELNVPVEICKIRSKRKRSKAAESIED